MLIGRVNCNGCPYQKKEPHTAMPVRNGTLSKWNGVTLSGEKFLKSAVTLFFIVNPVGPFLDIQMTCDASL